MTDARSDNVGSPQDHDGVRIGQAAWKSVRGWVILVSVLLISLGADLGSKKLAFDRIAGRPVAIDREAVLSASDPRLITNLVPRHPPKVVVPRVLEFTLVLNPGAVFGFGPGKRWFFVGFTGIALGFGVFMFGAWTGANQWFAHSAIGMLLGGGLGNLYDRLVFGCVRDFIHPLPRMTWPFGSRAEIWPYVSNVADLVLLIGIGMLLIHLWRRDRNKAATSA